MENAKNVLLDPNVMIHYEVNSGKPEVDAMAEASNSSAIVNVVHYIAISTGRIVEITTGPLSAGSVKKVFFIKVKDAEDDAIRELILAAVKEIFFERKRKLSWDDLLQNLTIEEQEKICRLRENNKLKEDCWQRLNRQKDVWNKRNSFFKALSGCQNIKSLEFSTGKSLKNNRIEYHIEANQFASYIQEYESDVIHDAEATVYIVSPILIKEAKGRWQGLYQENSIRFTMTDAEFTARVQNGDVGFKSGFYMVCCLEYEQYLDEEQELVRNNFRVAEVYRYGVDDHFVFTRKGRQKEANKRQLELPFN
jgi:hypothetical protein